MADLVTVTELNSRSYASIGLRRGASARHLGEILGVALPDAPIAVAGQNGLVVLGTAPGNWLAIDDTGNPSFARDLAARLEGLAAVADQSSTYYAVQLEGKAARQLIQSGCPIDLHPSVFGPGQVAVTQIAHMGIVLRCVSEADIYELACFRSFAGSFRHWLDEAQAAL